MIDAISLEDSQNTFLSVSQGLSFKGISNYTIMITWPTSEHAQKHVI